MSAKPEPVTAPSERESIRVAESARQTEWRAPSFMKELFLGNFRLDLIHPFPSGGDRRPEFVKFCESLAAFLRDRVDAVAIDATGEYPPEVVDGLKRMGAFGMKIPVEYGGLGFTQLEYSRIMELVGSVDGNLCALLSAHQSIGVPQPLKLFGTSDQKQRFLPRCAAGALSGFALTEERVGSDPARLSTVAEPLPDGSGWVLNGEKLWCTNGTMAELLVVMARHPENDKISAFIVETSWPGVTVEHRCRFMGLRALANGIVAFKNVRVPKDNLVGAEGQGLKIALVTLNTGRLTIPASAAGTAKLCLEVCRVWSGERVQWGQPIGRHEAISHKLADMAATTFAMDAVSDLASQLADRGGYDIRLEAAAAKEWNTVFGWRVVDDTMQIRGGRGYETEESLIARGVEPMPVERMMRDFRINLIFEGSSEIMHLFMAREAVDKHLQVAGALIDPDKPLKEKLAALPRMAAFYGTWYPTRWLGWGRWPRYSEFGSLGRHIRFVERSSRKLARSVFHGMVVHGGKLQRKQGFLFRLVDVANDLLAMAVAAARARQMEVEAHPAAAQAAVLADLFCRDARRRVRRSFRALWSNDDDFKRGVALQVRRGDHVWVELGALGLAPRGRQAGGASPR